MTEEKRREAIIAAIKNQTALRTVSKKAANDSLIKEGLFTASGQLSPNYGGPVNPAKKSVKNSRRS